MNNYAVITSHGRSCFYDCLNAIRPQVDHVFVVGHNFYPELPLGCDLIRYEVEVPNISTMWNLGIKSALGAEATFVAVLNDDAIVGPDWFSKVTAGMLSNGAVVGCMDDVGHEYLRTTESPSLPRLTGFAFILNTASGLMLDEQFQWWWGDTDFDWQARRAGGMVVVPGTIEHRYPNSTTTGILAEIAAQDRERFIAKWGSAPW